MSWVCGGPLVFDGFVLHTLIKATRVSGFIPFGLLKLTMFCFVKKDSYRWVLG